MPLQATSGAASYDGFGGGAAAVPNYIEDVFSTYLYTGTAVAQTITNNIDLSTKGGMVWTKNRNYGIAHGIVDTARGVLNTLITNNADASSSYQTVTSFGTTGFNVGTSAIANGVGDSTMVSWSWAKAPKFFDVVTYTGTGSARTVAHSLGAVPGCIIFKRTDNISDWAVYHRSLNGGTNPQDYYVTLNNTSAQSTSSWFGNTAPTSTVFSVDPSGGATNQSGGTYVAYLFAHDAGGFGLTGTDNVISCGSFNSTDSGSLITLGYEPQFVLWKKTNSAGGWFIADTMRGLTSNPPSNGQANTLYANTSGAEAGLQYYIGLDSKGFYEDGLGSGSTYIYIAIRRGPMKVPTLGTSVFSPNVVNAPLATKTTVGFPIDLQIFNYLPGDGGNSPVLTRLTGVSTNSTSSGAMLKTSATAAETSAAGFCLGWDNTGFQMPSGYTNSNVVFYNFQRAPGFFDEVCYTGNSVSGRDISHNLSVSPEMVIIKARSRIDDWVVRSSAFPTHGVNGIAYLNLTTAASNAGYSYVPTSTTFQVESNQNQNGSGNTYVAYLFATCAGVSKVGSYTGNGTTQTIDCGFGAGGARFVLLKRTDSTGGWYVYDTARGMTVLTDPYLFLNSTAAETATLGSVTTVSTGFALNSAILAAINVNAGTYVFLAVA